MFNLQNLCVFGQRLNGGLVKKRTKQAGKRVDEPSKIIKMLNEDLKRVFSKCIYF